MKKLEENFSLEKFGLKVRLVNESDAEFIAALRSDPERTKFMLTLDADTEKQKKWINEYKKRERNGVDYYFIYFNSKNNPIGVNRISQINFDELTCKVSGWIKRKGKKTDAAAMFLIQKDILFFTLGMQSFYSDMNILNKSVLKYYNFFDYRVLKTENNFIHLEISKDDYKKGIPDFKKEFYLQ